MLAAAEAQWEQVKPSCPAYTYTRQRSSVFGSCAITTVTVSGDVVSSRAYVASNSGCPPTADAGVTEQWTENGGEVGTHTDGAAAETVEQLFTECQGILALDPSQYSLFLALGFFSIPAYCTATAKQCVDDCTTGITVASFACAAPAG
jgi:hypothetical protein